MSKIEEATAAIGWMGARVAYLAVTDGDEKEQCREIKALTFALECFNEAQEFKASIQQVNQLALHAGMTVGALMRARDLLVKARPHVEGDLRDAIDECLAVDVNFDLRPIPIPEEPA